MGVGRVELDDPATDAATVQLDPDQVADDDLRDHAVGDRVVEALVDPEHVGDDSDDHHTITTRSPRGRIQRHDSRGADDQRPSADFSSSTLVVASHVKPGRPK